MKDKYIALWSGGKDSSWMVIEILKRGLPLDYILTYDTPELDEMYKYKEVFKNYVKSKYGAKFLTVPTGRMGIVYDWSLTPYTKGKLKGFVRGFPKASAMTWCTRELKVYPYNRYVRDHFKNCNIKKYYGIASDEPRRLYKDKSGLYPLADINLTESACLENLKDIGLHNKIYDHYSRTGCWFCPKQSKKGFKILHDHYPKKWKELLMWEEKIKKAGSEYLGVHINEITPGSTVAQLDNIFKSQLELF